MTPIVSSVWPTEVPLASFGVEVTSSGVTVDAQYEAAHDLTPVALGLITRELQAQAKLPNLVLSAKRVSVPRGAVDAGRRSRSVR
jgi:hypothetical protein